MSIQEKMKNQGIELPDFNPPAANYAPAVLTGNLLFVSGQTPKRAGKLVYEGKLGDLPVEDGYAAARICALNSLAAVNRFAGGLDNVKRMVKITVFVSSKPDFYAQAQVANGATDLFVEVFGDSGRPARSAIGMAVLPGNAPCEVEIIAELKDPAFSPLKD